MSDTTKARVLATAPNLSTMSDASFSIAIEDAALEIEAAVFGTYEELAQRCYVAHVLTLAQRDGSGELFQKKVGDVEVRFHSSTLKDPRRFDETGYGRRFIRITQKLIVPVDFVSPTTDV